jgi:hypothetical protein
MTVFTPLDCILRHLHAIHTHKHNLFKNKIRIIV